MAVQTPKSLQTMCRTILPQLLALSNGRRILRQVAAIAESDRWNSFNHFHRTTEKLVDYYERAGAQVEVESIQTGGQIGSGRWVIQEAADVHSATVDVVHPVRQRILDYAENPLARGSVERCYTRRWPARPARRFRQPSRHRATARRETAQLRGVDQ